MKVIRFTASWFHVVHGTSVPKYEAGKCYPVNEETKRHVEHGIAEEIDAPDDVEKAVAAADKAESAAAKAAEAADAARDTATLAQAAADLKA